MYKAALPQIK